jgi:hypothetical protein
MTLLAAFKILLFRYTGQEDILVGTPIANRNHIETEGLMGFFLNTLVLRTNISGIQSFLEILRAVRDVALQAYENQELPFEMVVDKLRPERRLSYNPLFQVLFVLLSAKSQSKQFSGLTLTHPSIKDETSKFDLGLFTSETEHGLRVAFRYSIDLFAQASVDRMLGHFEALLEGIAAHPDRRVSDVSLLSKEERNRLIHVSPKHLAMADRWFERYGDATVFFTRMLPIIRTFISLPAGVARMPFWRFTVLTLLGCIPWVLMLGLIGREVGDRWEEWRDYLHYFDYVVLAGIVALIVYLLIKRRRSGPEDADPETQPEPATGSGP